MNPCWSVAVVIPAHDEADDIVRCLRSVLASAVPDGCERVVVVVADRCRDDTACLARAAVGDQGWVIETHAGCVGAARRIGSEAVLAGWATRGIPTERAWLLSTDADSTVGLGWISAHLGLAEAGALAVAGTVAVASFEGHPDHVPARFARRYVLGADGTHDHVHGTNLGVRADRYAAAGGWHDLPTAEDHDLWDRVRALGGMTVSTTAWPVTTSGRPRGRAPDGFAALLVQLGRTIEPKPLEITG